jgi:hypothetical protein
VAFFHCEPQVGVPGGVGRESMGAAPMGVTRVLPPPTKPRPEWSKLSLL